MSTPSTRPFGATPTGETVDLITLDNGILSCQILTLGATLHSLHVPGLDGHRVDVVLGYDTLQEYLTHDAYLGATIGRYANRIAGGQFSLHGQSYSLAVNNGPNHLHGGRVGFSHRVWTVEELTSNRTVLHLDSPHGEEGYPGHLQVRLIYELQDSALFLHYQAVSDRDTPCNLTNHSYFNLGGHNSGPVLDQEITLFASQYTPTDPTGIPTGALVPVAGTPMDLRQSTPIGERLNAPFEQLIWGNGFDHNYVIDGPFGTMRPAARAVCHQTGIVMEVATTMPGIQLYTANYINEGRLGKGQALYGPRHAFCLETQFFPDSPNQPTFPSSILKAGESGAYVTCFSFHTQS